MYVCIVIYTYKEYIYIYMHIYVYIHREGAYACTCYPCSFTCLRAREHVGVWRASQMRQENENVIRDLAAWCDKNPDLITDAWAEGMELTTLDALVKRG